MSILTTLKLSDAAPARIIEPKHHARTKLVAFLTEQRAASMADIENRAYAPTCMRSRIDENGTRVRVEGPKRFRRAWFNNRQADGSEVLYFQLRYGNKPLPIAKGKTSIEIGNLKELPAVIDKIVEAVHAGELDEVLAAVAAERRSNFSRKTKTK